MSERRPSGRASLMVTCLTDVFYPEVGVRIVRLLRRLGVDVDVPAGQTCCGLPLLNSGYRAEAATVAARNLALFGQRRAPAGALGLLARPRSRRCASGSLPPRWG